MQGRLGPVLATPHHLGDNHDQWKESTRLGKRKWMGGASTVHGHAANDQDMHRPWWQLRGGFMDIALVCIVE